MVTHEEPFDHYLNRLIGAVASITDALEYIDAKLERLEAIETKLERIGDELENLSAVIEAVA